jgi:hypothetical protein
MVNSYPSTFSQLRRWSSDLHPDLKKYLAYALAVIFVYALLVGCRITTSHTGIMTGSASEKSTILLGQPRQERSDEFLRGSPLVIASLRGTPAVYKTPFELTNSIQAENNLSLAKKVFNFLQSPDALLNRVLVSILPLENAFAANWWSLHLLLFLALPAWFLLIGGRLNIAVATSIGVTFTSTSAWFSYLPMQLIAYSSGGMTCLLLAVRLANRRALLLWRFPIVLAVGLLAGKYFVPVLQYPPWGFPVLGIATCLTLGWMLEVPKRLKPLWIWPTLAASAVFMALLTYLVNKDLYSAALSTVYPGQRRAVGGGGETPFLGGSLSWVMQTSFARKSGYTNPEYAYGPTFLLIVGAFLCSINWQFRKRLSGLYGSLLAIVVASIVCLWGTTTWPKLLQVINPLKFIPGSRATMIVGTLAILIVGHAFSTYASPKSQPEKGALNLGSAVLCGSLVAIFIGEDVEWLRVNYFTGVPPWQGFVSVLGASLLGMFLVLRFRVALAWWTTIVLIFASTLFVNPITIGLGPLKNSDALQTLQDLAKTDTTARWASSGYYLDALIMSAGVPQLSGQQFLAPNKPFWEKIDLEKKFRPFWNRGQSYVNLQIAPGYKFQIWNPSPDVIQIVGDPCDARFSRVELGWYVSSIQINSPCLSLKSQTNWMNNRLYLYEVPARES